MLASMIPNARFVPLESKNHLLLKTEPAWQQFLDEVVEFTNTEKTTHSGEQPAHSHDKTFDELTRREKEILDLIARGLDNNQIAASLVISSKTVRNHINNIYSKLQVTNRPRAIIKAREAGMGRGIE
jgi:DNA-binding NarL/FixJ family response regulator